MMILPRNQAVARGKGRRDEKGETRREIGGEGRFFLWVEFCPQAHDAEQHSYVETVFQRAVGMSKRDESKKTSGTNELTFPLPSLSLALNRDPRPQSSFV